ncbi:MAG TPA: insulinase family protein [Phycisphaerales bacterium]|nr:insulinase family protein [Phycisphaerales bacterium]
MTQPVWPVVCPTDSVPKLGRRSEHMAERSGYSYLLLCYRFPREGHPDYEACELLSRVIADGDSCRLYDKFVREEKKFLEVWTSYESQARDHPLLHLGMAVAGEERRPQDSAAEVIDFLHRLSTSLTAEELEKVRVSWMAEEAFGTDELEDWSLEIAGRVVLMPWEKVWQQSQRIEAVTLQDLKRVADLYLSKDNCVSLTLEGQSG